MAFKSLLDPTFTYRNSANTDVRLTFERARREQKEAAQPEHARDGAKVVAILGSAGAASARRGAEGRTRNARRCGEELRD